MKDPRDRAEMIVQRMHTMTSTGDIYDRKVAGMIEAALLAVREEAITEYEQESVDLAGVFKERDSAIHDMNLLIDENTRLQELVEGAREALKTLKVAVNDKQPDPGATAFISQALAKLDPKGTNE